MNFYTTLIHKIYIGSTKIEGDSRKRTIPNFIEAVHAGVPEHDKGVHFYASLISARAEYKFDLGQHKAYSDKEEMLLRSGTKYISTALEVAVDYCKTKITDLNGKNVPADEGEFELLKSSQMDCLSYASIALIAIYKGLPCNYIDDAKPLLLKYNAKRKSYKSLITKYRDLSEDSAITRTGSEPNTIKFRIQSIESILQYLSEDEKQNALADLATIKQN